MPPRWLPAYCRELPTTPCLAVLTCVEAGLASSQATSVPQQLGYTPAGGNDTQLGMALDIVEERLALGGKLRLLSVMDEHTRERLAVEVGSYMRS